MKAALSLSGFAYHTPEKNASFLSDTRTAAAAFLTPIDLTGSTTVAAQAPAGVDVPPHAATPSSARRPAAATSPSVATRLLRSAGPSSSATDTNVQGEVGTGVGMGAGAANLEQLDPRLQQVLPPGLDPGVAE